MDTGAAGPGPGPNRRPRAPTITIDTSEVQPPGSEPSSDPQSTTLRKSGSFTSQQSRPVSPASPHNVSSPTYLSNPQGFLSVPQQQRPRGDSIDTEGGETSASSDGTYVGSDGHSMEMKRTQSFPAAGDHPVLSDTEALKPDPGTEADFTRENNPFAYAPGHMSKMFNPKSLGAFHAVGGVAGLEKGLLTDLDAGISPDEQHFADRKRVFADNVLPERKAKNILQLAWMAYNDKVLILLTIAAVISLALGLYQSIGQKHGPGQPRVEWVEGVAIVVAILVVVLVGALNDWQKERQFVKLNKKKESRNVKVIRSGKTQEISIHDILVGDVLLVEPGDILPVDGIFIAGHGVKCDESSATGESDILKKTIAEEVFRAMESGASLKKIDPFMISGAKVTEGFGQMLVTAVGVNSSLGKTMVSLREDKEATPLQVKLNKLADQIAKLGSAAALLLFIVLFIEFCVKLPTMHTSPAEKGSKFLEILIVAVTIVVVAVPEGLPLAVTLALAFATKRMLKDNNLVRVLRSCETMGNATCICSDKTGTLTQNVMTVVAGSIGTSHRFTHPSYTHTTGNTDGPTDNEMGDVSAVPVAEFVNYLSQDVKTLLKDMIAINSTAFDGEQDGKPAYIGSKTETALLDFARDYLGMDKVSIERNNAEIKQMFPFDSGRKCMAMVIKARTGGYRLLLKGASEIVLRNCTTIVRDPTRELQATAGSALGDTDKEAMDQLIDGYASQSLRTIGFAYRDFESWPPRDARRMEDDASQVVFDDIFRDLTFLGLVGIEDPLRPGVPESVADCIMAGVKLRMVTGDNINTAKAIAAKCGIFTSGGVALEGPEFRRMTKHEQLAVIPKLQVLARSSPDDKRVLVKRLKDMGETVAVTGDGTNDAPALKAADVGFAMNISGTEVAKEASDIILMDDNFSSIVKALMWGRAVNDAVRKFLQFQITVNITAVLLAFVSAVSSDQEKSVLTAVQLLWVNLIMDTMAALALATDPPTRKILNRKPDPKSAPLFTLTMWKMILGQAIYQLVITFVLYFAGPKILHYDTVAERNQLQTLVFNTFVWMQIFNIFNNRRLDNHFNVFEGIHRNWFFIGIFMIMVGGQTLIIFVGSTAFNVVPQSGTQWAIALVLGAISVPIGLVLRLIPDEFVSMLIPNKVKEWSESRHKEVDEENPFQYNESLMNIRQELAFIKKYKGGRLAQLRFTMKHPKEVLMGSRSPSRSRASSSVAAAGIMAGSIGGWAPARRVNPESETV